VLRITQQAVFLPNVTRNAKKPRRNEASLRLVAGQDGLRGYAAQLVSAPVNRRCRAGAPRLEPAPAQNQILFPVAKMKKPVQKGPALFILVAGAGLIRISLRSILTPSGRTTCVQNASAFC
jgi:hypothetical protein